MGKRNYHIGIDVGVNSVGIAAVEIGDDGMPVHVLNAQSVVHDGGVDPSVKSRDSRRKVSGQARRSRRLYRHRRRRLRGLDTLLSSMGYPIVDTAGLEGFQVWQVRARAASQCLATLEQRRCAVSIACRHIARHRGWRNPYRSIRSLLSATNPLSSQYEQLRDHAMAALDGQELADGLTVAQLVCAAARDGEGTPPRVRTRGRDGKQVREGLIDARLTQDDHVHELRRIMHVQQIPDDEARQLLMAVFDQESPRGSAEEHVGKDPLDPSQPRGLKASLAFQRYRIAAAIANLRVAVPGGEQPLMVDQKREAYRLLTDGDCKDLDLSWDDVAVRVGIEPANLRGVGRAMASGERVPTKPPRMDTVVAIGAKGTPKALKQWWKHSDDDTREAMVALLSNTVDLEAHVDQPGFAQAVDLVESLDDTDLAGLDSVDLPSGRGAYSLATMRRLTRLMVDQDFDLSGAIRHEFHKDGNWMPPQPRIDEPTGNASVDRVLRIVNRFLLDATDRWGKPISVQVEHVRDGFLSTKSAKAHEDTSRRRHAYREKLKDRLRDEFAVARPRDFDVRKLQAYDRQGGCCLYCGRPLTFAALQMDHIVPRKGEGSTNTRENLAAVCEECNRMKRDTPFALWADTEAAKRRGVSFDGAIARAKALRIDSYDMDAKQARVFRKEMIKRLRKKDADGSIDNRPIESVAWMADELHRRIDWHFNHASHASGTPVAGARVKVAVYPGAVTAEARKVSGIDGNIHLIGSSRKTRLDRRHHAVDAAVIAMMTPTAARILSQRIRLRRTQRDYGLEETWRHYPTAVTRGVGSYESWLACMETLRGLLNELLDHDRIAVLRMQRYALGNSKAHEDKPKLMAHRKVSDRLDAQTIRHASTPALYCALTRHADYDEQEGLSADPARTIMLNGTRLGPDDAIDFFTGNAAMLAVRGGQVGLGKAAYHHARIYRYPTGKGGYAYGMLCVYRPDLLHMGHRDLFHVELAAQSLTMRYNDPALVHAIREGQARYLGYLVVGDEIELQKPPETKKTQRFVQRIAGMEHVIPAAMLRWTVRGFYAPGTIELRPTLLSSEGLQEAGIRDNEAMQADLATVLNESAHGWNTSINALAKLGPQVVRRNAFGEKRFSSKSRLPTSWNLG